jgi:hypothetical protein
MNETRMPTFSTPITIQQSLRIPSQKNKIERLNKRSKIGMDKVKLFADDMILYLKDTKISTKNS